MSTSRFTPKISGAMLSSVIEREIIPRLFVTHPEASERCLVPVPAMAWEDVDDVPAPALDPPVDIDVEALARLVLSCDRADRIIGPLQELLDRGMGIRQVYLDFLTPIARRIGELWQQDRCSIIEVTLSLSRLHYVLLEIGRRNGGIPLQTYGNPRAFLTPVPGEQHIFGLLMVQELLLQAGWDLDGNYDSTIGGIIKIVSSGKFDVVGFSINGPDLFETLQSAIQNVRKHSLCKNLSIIVGGGLFKDQPQFASKVNGATVIGEGVNVVEAAENLIYSNGRNGACGQSK